MTTALATLLIGVAVTALIVAFIAYLWVNRTPSTDERFDEYGRVPLFGVDLSGAATVHAQAVDVEDVAPTVAENPGDIREVRRSPQPVSEETTAVEYQHAVARPAGQPVSIDTSALDSANGTTPAPPPAPTPKSTNRIGGRGWGTNRGWPAEGEMPVTPRFVPPIREGRPTPSSGSAQETPANGNGVYADGVHGSMVEGHRVRFSTPVEGTLQFLPGRLQITSGLDTGREIRFVRVPGPNGTEVTFGRNEGPLYRHIQLRDQTVSREHARMTLVDGRWLLTNLSNTNPVAYNGRVLSPGEHQALDDGDRLEMGEVVFSFRSR